MDPVIQFIAPDGISTHLQDGSVENSLLSGSYPTECGVLSPRLLAFSFFLSLVLDIKWV